MGLLYSMEPASKLQLSSSLLYSGLEATGKLNVRTFIIVTRTRNVDGYCRFRSASPVKRLATFLSLYRYHHDPSHKVRWQSTTRSLRQTRRLHRTPSLLPVVSQSSNILDPYPAVLRAQSRPRRRRHFPQYSPRPTCSIRTMCSIFALGLPRHRSCISRTRTMIRGRSTQSPWLTTVQG